MVAQQGARPCMTWSRLPGRSRSTGWKLRAACMASAILPRCVTRFRLPGDLTVPAQATSTPRYFLPFLASPSIAAVSEYRNERSIDRLILGIKQHCSPRRYALRLRALLICIWAARGQYLGPCSRSVGAGLLARWPQNRLPEARSTYSQYCLYEIACSSPRLSSRARWLCSPLSRRRSVRPACDETANTKCPSVCD